MGGIEKVFEFFLFTFPDHFLLAIGGAVIIASALYPFLHFSESGVVVGPDVNYLTETFPVKSCRSENCRSAISIKVRLKTGSLVLAEASPCAACMERLQPGDAVRILRIGDRCVAQKIPVWMSRKC
ncbi:MAG: hypothetical protein PHS17_05855 [Desulfobacterales bacterium]|nr:hypothetical protein [Desulfobacterales bacterium]